MKALHPARIGRAVRLKLAGSAERQHSASQRHFALLRAVTARRRGPPAARPARQCPTSPSPR